MNDKEFFGRCVICKEYIEKGEDYKEIIHLHWTYDNEAGQNGYKIMKQEVLHIHCYNYIKVLALKQINKEKYNERKL